MADQGDDRRPALRVVPGGSGHASREEEALLAAFLVGDDEAFGALVHRHERLVLSLVRRYARTPEDARDLAQRTFLRAFEAARRALRHAPRGAIPFRRWLIRIAVNLGKNHLRDSARFRLVSLEAVDQDRLRSRAEGAADELERAERVARVRSAVLRLPRRQREVLTLRIDAELPFAEIAEALQITENAARVNFHHATRRLKELVEEGTP
ncbi:MAG TPA: sigma-70 family RNA polymerase sigma factor [Anaeromyxobacter sp.]|nr:sigma-70 family RNA polymerase sigma factor [Anaeromyxobacter sp.]